MTAAAGEGITVARALSWRLRRHALDPVTGTDVADVLDRVVALRGWPADLAELACAVRQEEPAPETLQRSLDEGEVIRGYAFRGGSYVFGHQVAAVLLACRRATRVWETRRFQQQAGFTLPDWQPLRDAVHEALASGPATRQEISDHLARVPALRQLAAAALGAGSDSLYKPLHWWGDICFGPTRDGQSTFRLLDGDPRWPGLPALEDAGPRAVELYLGSYGPATLANLEYWLTEGLSVPRRRLSTWLAELGDTVTPVSIAGTDAYALTRDVPQLIAAEPSDAVRLLPGFDPWIFGPGTADDRLLPTARRALATKGAQLVIRGGVASGTWRIQGGQLAVAWFDEAGTPPRADLEQETARIGRLRGRLLNLALEHG